MSYDDDKLDPFQAFKIVESLLTHLQLTEAMLHTHEYMEVAKVCDACTKLLMDSPSVKILYEAMVQAKDCWAKHRSKFGPCKGAVDYTWHETGNDSYKVYYCERHGIPDI